MSQHLGPYRLGARLGRGGMGEVWQGIHAPTERPVAVKVLHRTDAPFVEAVRTEARAIARLDHPHVVALLDLGTVPDAGVGELPGGSPFLVMELVEGGDLNQRKAWLSWAELRRLADELLDALSHAHARGVVHRDLKPANVLLASPTSTRPGWRLTDFGLAHGRFDPKAAVREGPRGSPRYMAPEQFQGYRRDLGPWTDLYGLGAMLWALITGRPVFDADTVSGQQHAHLHDAPPAFEPRVAVPDGLEEWLRICLAKRTVDRFATAADAMDALRRLDRGTALAPAPEEARPGAGSDSDTFDLTESTELIRQRLQQATPSSIRPRRPSPPSHPPSWRNDIEVAPRAPLASASLALALLRQPPFAGRELERDRLWNALGRVHRTGQPYLVVLTGPAGMGETRLARWLVHRARETGSAHALLIHHGANGEGGLPELVADVLQLHGLDRTQTRERLLFLTTQGELADDIDTDAIVGVLHPDDHPVPWERRRALVLDLVRGLTVDRPLVLVLDDTHHSEEARELARTLLVASLPVLIVATGQPPSDPALAAEVEALLARRGGERMDLGPLDAAARRALVRRMVDLDDALAQRLEARSLGHPQLLVEMLVGWIRDGALEPGPRGYRLVHGATLTIPDSLEEAVARLLDTALDGRDPFEARALEVAAILGDAIDVRAWARTCLLAGASPGEDFVQHMVDAGVWRREEEQGGSLRFDSSLLRAVVLARAREAGRLASHHRAAARRLAQDGGRLDRLGLHRLRGGDQDAAVEPLLRAAEDELLARDLGEAARIAGWLGEALTALPHGVRARDRADAHLLQATLHVLRGRGEDADEDLDAAEALGRAHRWEDVRVRVARLRARRALRQRLFDDALSHLRAAIAVAEKGRDRRVLGRARLQLGSVLLYLGRLNEAERELQEARPLTRTHPADLARLLTTLARVHTQRGDRERARELLDQALPWFRAAGSAWGPVVVSDHLAHLDRLDGRLDRAAERYREVYAAYLRLGLRQADVALLHGALVDLQRGRPDEALAVLRHCVAAFQAQRAPLLGALAWAARLQADAAHADAGAFDEALEVLQRELASTQLVHVELRPTLTQAAALAEQRLDAGRAQAVRVLLRSHADAIGVDSSELPDSELPR